MLKWIRRNLLDWYTSDMPFGWNVSSFWGAITRPFTETWHWMAKSLQYSRMLWKDFDWDYSYILVLLRYKIKRTRLRMVDNNLVLKIPVMASEMLHVEKLIDKFMDNEFCADEFTAHDEKWGEMKMSFEDMSTSSSIAVGSRLRLNRSKTITDADKAHEQAEYRVILDRSEREKQECWNEIFDTMRERMQGWWD